MAEEAPRAGAALRLYQVVGILALGWAAGRLPEWLAARTSEEARLRALVGGSPAAPAAPASGASADEVAAIAAEVAARVASETVARLVAAGWGPAGPAPVPAGPAPGPAARPAEAVVRIVHEVPRQAAAPGWSLPPMAAPAAPASAGPAAADAAPALLAEAAPAAPARPAAARDEAFRLASEGYAALRAGDRRAAADGLARALALDPAAPQASAWAADLRTLRRRLSFGVYALAREGAQGDAVAATPVLGSTQTGALAGWTLDPLARRRVTAFARVATGSDARGRLDPETAEAAVGVRVDPLPRVPVHVAVERRIALGAFGRNAWSARLAGGTARQVSALGRPVELSVYGEGGVVGFGPADLYGGGEATALAPLVSLDRIRLSAGVGGWASGQEGFITSHRVDVGPMLKLGFANTPVSARLDYRVKVAGNAAPGSGLALTIAGDF
ncbi:hypothetical protein [Thermaurantiacus tibetensis]|uniref:hypothetical protein n=1 Tax=Thermaurantiacus tibetensis TaxID=2759035 RepID=UPI00188F0716|nr:hypothetical protein [Thermaurantiacus tibetensis]